MNGPAQVLISGLRGLHLPPPVSLWPPAPGWWMLLVVIVLFGAAVGYAFVQWRRRSGLRAARAELVRLRSAYRKHGDTVALAAGLSQLLRGRAVSCYPRERVAGLTGAAWLEFLDRSAASRHFVHGPARAIASVPFRRTCDVADRRAQARLGESLLEAAEHWIRTAGEQRRPKWPEER